MNIVNIHQGHNLLSGMKYQDLPRRGDEFVIDSMKGIAELPLWVRWTSDGMNVTISSWNVHRTQDLSTDTQT